MWEILLGREDPGGAWRGASLQLNTAAWKPGLGLAPPPGSHVAGRMAAPNPPPLPPVIPANGAQLTA